MKFYPSGEDLAKDMGVPLQTLVDAHQKHFEAAKKQEKDPEGTTGVRVCSWWLYIYIYMYYVYISYSICNGYLMAKVYFQ